MKTLRTILPATLILLATLAHAHDSWVETNINVVRTGDVVHVHLMMGNHGNDHRDFKLAGKVDPQYATLQVLHGNASPIDLKPRLTDQGYAPGEGYWTARFQPQQPGLYMIAHTYDRVVSYAPTRSIKSGKTFFVASESLDSVPVFDGFDRQLGHALELVPLTNPVTPMGPGQSIRVKLLFQGKPLAGARVSFIPRGQTLAEDFDQRFERLTDDNGIVRFEFTEANHYLIVAHHADDRAGEGYTSTKYSATMTVYVPGICGCCE